MRDLAVWQRLIIFTGLFAILVLVVAAAGYFILPRMIENQAAVMIEKQAGFPARVELKVPFNFIFTGKVEKARVYMPVIQLNQLNIRNFELQTKSFTVPPGSILRKDLSFLKKVEGEGSFIITPGDLNNYLKHQGREYLVEISDYELYLTTYAPGVGKMKIAGRLAADASGATFVAERIVEPRLPSLLFNPQVWINTSFSFTLSPADRLFTFERFFIDKKYIKVFFKLKKDFYEEISSTV